MVLIVQEESKKMSYSTQTIQTEFESGKFEILESLSESQLIQFSEGLSEEESYREFQKEYFSDRYHKDSLQEFDKEFIEKYSEACIRVEMRDYPNESRVSKYFVTQSSFEEWLEHEYQREFDEYCQGYGSNDLLYLNIVVYFLNGSIKEVY